MTANRHPHVWYWLGIILVALSVVFLWPAIVAAMITAVPMLAMLFIMGMLLELLR